MMSSAAQRVKEVEPETALLGESGGIPNNRVLPLVVYRAAVDLAGLDEPAAAFEELFTHNGWTGTWRNGVYPFHHYHSTCHEVLGCYSGDANIQMGGPDGPKVELKAGDVAILPAGTGHKRLFASGDFGVVGAYPPGQAFNMLYGHEGERPGADEAVAQVPKDVSDPLYGGEGIGAWP